MNQEIDVEKEVRSTYFLLLCIVLAIVFVMAIKKDLSNVSVKTEPEHGITNKRP